MPPEIDKPTTEKEDPTKKPAEEPAVVEKPATTATATAARPGLDAPFGSAPSTDAAVPLSDGIFNLGNHNFREIAIGANVAAGTRSVTNMTYTVAGPDGPREISGPVSYNGKGHQYVIDMKTMDRFRVMPAGEDGSTALKPVGRKQHSAEPLPVVEQRAIDPYRVTVGGTPVTSSTGSRVETPPATGTAVERPAVRAAGDPVPATGKPEEQAPRVEMRVEPVKVPTATAPAVPVESTVDRTVPGKTADPPLKVEIPIGRGEATVTVTPEGRGIKVEVRAGGGDDPTRKGGGDEHGRPGEPRKPSDQSLPATDQRTDQQRRPDQVVADGRDTREIVLRAEPPMTRNELADIRNLIRQDPTVLERIRFDRQPQMQPGPNPVERQPGQTPGERQPGDRGYGERFQDKGQLTIDKVIGVDQRGQIQFGDRSQLPNQPGERGHGERPPGLPTEFVERGRPDGAQRRNLENVLADLMKNRDTRPAVAELVAHLQNGRLPNEQALQNNRNLQDVIKALGPEGIADIRKILGERDGALQSKGDTKFDANVSPRMRELLESLTNPVGRKQDGEARSALPGAIASERLLDIVRQNDKVLTQRIPDADTTRTLIQELGKVVRDLNALSNLDQGRPLTIRDVISRTLDEGRPSTQLQQPIDRKDFVIRPQTADDLVVRALLDRLQPTRPQDFEPRRQDTVIRTENIAMRLEPKVEIKADARQDIRPENMPVRPEDLGRPIRELTVKAELIPNTKPDAATARPDAPLVVRQDRVVEAEQTAQAKQQQQQQDLLPTGKNPLDQQQQQKEEEEAAKLKLKQLKEKEEKEDLAADAATLLALQAKKRKEQDEKEKQEKAQEKDKKEPEKRQKYIVKPGDTLESIATRMLRDKRLSGLIYEINKDTISTTVVGGKQVPKLQVKMVIWLPTPTESKDYRARLLSSQQGGQSKFTSAEEELTARFGSNWSNTASGGDTADGATLEDMEDAARAAYQSRRKHIESLLGPLSSKSDAARLKHVVRLGETLKSVAMKHPALLDVTIWKLVAELNGLSIKTDDKGTPLAKLSRGQALILPSQAEVAAFKQRESAGTVGRPTGPIEMPTRSCPECNRVTFASALLCPACGTAFEGTRPVTSTKSNSAPPAKREPSSPRAAQDCSPYEKTTVIPTSGEPHPASTDVPFIPAREYSESARLVTAGTTDDLTGGYKLRLEVKSDREWVPLVAYEVFLAISLRHEYVAGGARKTIRIDLPPQAAIELATNDLQSNWRTYQKAYASAKQSN